MVGSEGGGASNGKNKSIDDEAPSESKSDEEKPASEARPAARGITRAAREPLAAPLAPPLGAPALNWPDAPLLLCGTGTTMLCLRQTPDAPTGERAAIAVHAPTQRGKGFDSDLAPTP